MSVMFDTGSSYMYKYNPFLILDGLRHRNAVDVNKLESMIPLVVRILKHAMSLVVKSSYRMVLVTQKPSVSQIPLELEVFL